MKKRNFIKAFLLGSAALMVPRRSSALEYYPRPSGKKWAVLYSTWCGSARDAGVWISEGMDGIANVFDVREKPDLSGYDHIIVGGAIRSGRVSQEMQDFLTKNQAVIKPRLRGYFAVCGNMMQPVTPEVTSRLIDRHLAAICGVTGIPSGVFLGRITWGLMEPDVREQMQKMPGMKEYDNLKRDECMAFGREVLEKNK
ncbi:MAG TPA: flavodoxin domain-containing protein [Bacteroidales bacterium]|nr:flavodoxin domain-containing protein [Bacteroidales bacterium]